MESFKILLADNHLIFRRGFALVLQGYADFKIVGEATNSQEVPMLVDLTRPDVLIVDYSLLADNGKINKSYRNVLSRTKSLVLTGVEQGNYFLALLEVGVRGYVCRDASIESLIQAMRAVLAGHVVCSPEMAGKLAGVLHGNGNGDGKGLSRLSVRQQSVLELVAKGFTNKEIAAQLSISETTVKAHIQGIMGKFHAKNRGQAVAYASKEGFIRIGNSP